MLEGITSEALELSQGVDFIFPKLLQLTCTEDKEVHKLHGNISYITFLLRPGLQSSRGNYTQHDIMSTKQGISADLDFKYRRGRIS